MPIAAVPEYLGNDFKEASPGLRFGMYLKLWGVNRRTNALLWKKHDISYEVRGQDRQEREVQDDNKVSALSAAQVFTERDRLTMRALAVRQADDFNSSISKTSGFMLKAQSIAPFSTGLGNEHPLENGFSFLNPYGLPYFPASGVKGVLRQAAHELALGEWGETHGWNANMINALFGKEDSDEPQRGALAFWDVIPQIHGDGLQVEIMTPHQSHYYQQKADKKAGGSKTPHDSGQPTPITFLTVPAGSDFTFYVQCQLQYLERIGPELLIENRWQSLLESAFEHAFTWLGFGAKTAVGYGAMQSEATKLKQAELAEQRNAQEIQVKQEAEIKRQAETATLWAGVRIKFMSNGALWLMGKDRKEISAITPKGKELLDTLPAEMKAKITSDYYKNPKVNAYVADGKTIVRIEPDQS